ncbi:MAG TPA: FKBP-type peptidyl-prolyl cis-trans isomerase [Verrucomicrobiae bacterium]|jgi:FKBP-type peptidyl-prolyl cis-trans isomerase|nr:FKBP-type peptidyl-prolyl cis-trans isomerase [Verrucomicrobiae bacterium]
MKRHIISFLTLALIAAPAVAQNGKPASPGPIPPTAMTMPPATDFSKIFKDDKEKVGYAVGMYAAAIKDRLTAQGIEFDTNMMIKGFTDLVTTSNTMITQEQKMEVLRDLDRQMRAKMEEKRKMQAEENRIKGEKNKAEGTAFLEKNKTLPGVVTLPDGLQYKVLKEGTGEIPKGSDEVSVNYRGSLIDGTEFDSSYKRNQPFNTKVEGGIIKGWTEALELMKTGSKWEIYVPSELAYGPSGRPPTILPNAVLVFEIELLSTTPQPASAAIHPTAPSAPLTSDIIKVPSAEEIKKGAKIETIKAEDLDKERAKTNQSN